jgi:hypothetical protein
MDAAAIPAQETIMDQYQRIQEFEEKLEADNRQEFVDEQRLASELFNLYLEAGEITSQQWALKPERRATFELINRTFNDLHAGWKLIMEGLLPQGMTLLRGSIECAHYIKLFEVDAEFRDEWLEGKDFFLRDVRERMQRKGISPAPQDLLYKFFSQVYTHPSKKGTASHVADSYPIPGEQRVLFMYGGVKDIPRTRIMALHALGLIYVTIYFLWQEMFPIDKNIHPTWCERFSRAIEQIYSIEAKAKQEWMEFIEEQRTTVRKIIDDYLKWFLS